MKKKVFEKKSEFKGYRILKSLIKFFPFRFPINFKLVKNHTKIINPVVISTFYGY